MAARQGRPGTDQARPGHVLLEHRDPLRVAVRGGAGAPSLANGTSLRAGRADRGGGAGHQRTLRPLVLGRATLRLVPGPATLLVARRGLGEPVRVWTPL